MLPAVRKDNSLSPCLQPILPPKLRYRIQSSEIDSNKSGSLVGVPPPELDLGISTTDLAYAAEATPSLLRNAYRVVSPVY